MAKTGRKGYGEELELIRRYSDLSELYFQRLRERLESDDKKDQDLALNLLNGVFTKMIPQDVNPSLNINLNKEAATPEELEAVEQALSKSVSDSQVQE